MVMTPLSFPFMRSQEDTPWTLWAAQSPVASLLEPNTDMENGPLPDTFSDIEYNPWPEGRILQDCTIQRPQYTAVLDRMNKANRKTGTFTAWIT